MVATAQKPKRLTREDRRVVAGLRSTLSAWKPPPRVSPSEWAARNVWLPTRTAALPGRYNVTLVPYVREPLDCLIDDTVETIVLQWATQSGKTQLWIAALAYAAACDPGPMMLIGPNETSVRELTTTRVYPVFDGSPRLKNLVLSEYRRVALFLDLGDSVCFCGWSGSVTRLGEKTVRWLWLTEVDKWSKQDTGEADSLALATERVKAMPNHKILVESTPTLKGDSRIETEYQRSDQRTYHVPCPHCRAYQELEFEQLKWPRGGGGHSCTPAEARDRSWYECKHCERRITDIHKHAMLGAGRWARAGECVNKDGTIGGQALKPGRIAGFHLSSLYSPFLTFGQVAEAWLKAWASRRPERIQNVVNGWLARTWEIPAKQTRKDEILAHRGLDEGLDYAPDTIPFVPLALVMTVDVQEEELHYLIRAWGEQQTSALVRYGTVKSFDAVDRVSKEVFEGPAGDKYSIEYVFVDAGYKTKIVYAQCQQRRWNPIKGHDNAHTATIRVNTKLVPGCQHYTVSSPVFKEQLFDVVHDTRLGEVGAWLLHREANDDYAKQLMAEKRIKEPDRFGQERVRWVKTNPENHWLDLEAYQLAAAAVLGFDQPAAEDEDAESEPEAAEPDEAYDVLPEVDMRDWEN